MNYILKHIKQIPLNRVAFISKTKNYLYSDIINLYKKNEKTIQKLKNKCVVIKGQTKLDFALILSLLDGHVKRILFLPIDINSSLHTQYYHESDVNVEVYLDNEVLKINTINTNNTLEKIANTQWIIPTSGTTSKPKLIIHTLESLTRTSKINLDIGNSYTWGLTFDIYRFSGIQVFLQALSGGSSLIIPENNDSIQDIIKIFILNNCNIISATPSFWRKILMSETSKKLNLKRITLGGEITDESLLRALKNRFNNIKIIHIYASTEIGVGFSVTDCKAGFPYSYIKDGVADIQLKIDKNSLLWIKPHKKTPHYLSTNLMYNNKGFLNTGDLVYIKNNRVYFLGRESGSINVGGNKVHPEEVEEKLLSSGLISFAYVYAKKSPILGSLVCAKIVPNKKNVDSLKLKKEIISYCRNNLEKYKIPAILTVIDSLEITQSGKIKRG